MAKGAHNVGVGEVLSQRHLHGGPIRGALDVLVLLGGHNLQMQCIQCPCCAFAISLLMKGEGQGPLVTGSRWVGQGAGARLCMLLICHTLTMNDLAVT